MVPSCPSFSADPWPSKSKRIRRIQSSLEHLSRSSCAAPPRRGSKTGRLNSLTCEREPPPPPEFQARLGLEGTVSPTKGLHTGQTHSLTLKSPSQFAACCLRAHPPVAPRCESRTMRTLSTPSSASQRAVLSSAQNFGVCFLRVSAGHSCVVGIVLLPGLHHSAF